MPMLTRGTGPDGSFRTTDSNEYPQFRLMRAAVRDDAEMIAVSWVERADLTYASDAEMEKAHRQYVSGWMFNAFGLKPALGRLLNESGRSHTQIASLCGALLRLLDTSFRTRSESNRPDVPHGERQFGNSGSRA